MAGNITKRKTADYPREVESVKSDERSYYGQGEFFIPSENYGKTGFAGITSGEQIGAVPGKGQPKDTWQMLAEGFSRDGEKLTRNSGSKDRVAAFDFTFTAPKDFSALYAASAVAGDKLAHELHADFRESSKVALEYLQEHAAFGITRDAAGRTHKVKVDILVGLFGHETARSDDPHVHDHNMILNVGRVSDPEEHRRLSGASPTKKLAAHLCLESKYLMQHQNTAAALGQVHLAWKLREKGVILTTGGYTFGIKNMPAELIDRWSSRTKQVEIHAVAFAMGMRNNNNQEAYIEAAKLMINDQSLDLASDSVRADAIKFKEKIDANFGGSIDYYFDDNRDAWRQATLATREDKSEASTDLIEKRWAQDMANLGHSPEQILESCVANKFEQQLQFEEKTAFEAIKMRASEHSYVTEPQLMRFAFDEFTGYVDVNEAKALAAKFVATQMVHIGHDHGKDCALYATQEILDIESELLDIVSTSKRTGIDKTIIDQMVNDAYASGKTMTAEQEHAARVAMQDDHTVTVIEGTAGAGKTYTIEVAVNGYKATGHEVHAIALSWSAAGVLKEATKAEKSQAVDKFLSDLDRKKIQLNDKSVVFLDESGLVDSKKMHRVAKAVHEAGAKLILTGDSLQLKPVEAGSSLRSIVNEIRTKRNGDGLARIDTIFRQKSAEQRDAVHHFAAGRAGQGLATYIKNGKLHFDDNEKSALEHIAKDSLDYLRKNPDKTQIIITPKTSQAMELNARFQAEGIASGKLSGGGITLNGFSTKAEFFVGEPIQFRVNDKDDKYGNKRFTNRQVATIVSIKNGNIEFDLGDGKRLTMNQKDPALYNAETKKHGLDHAYATTVYSSQGQTVDRVAMLASMTMDRALAYVAASRHKYELAIYAMREELAEAINNSKSDEDWRSNNSFTKSELAGQLAASWTLDKDLGTAIEILRKTQSMTADQLRSESDVLRREVSEMMKVERAIAEAAQREFEPEAQHEAKLVSKTTDTVRKADPIKVKIGSTRKVNAEAASGKALADAKAAAEAIRAQQEKSRLEAARRSAPKV